MGFYGSIMYEDMVARKRLEDLLEGESDDFDNLSQNLLEAIFNKNFIIGDIDEDEAEETE